MKQSNYEQLKLFTMDFLEETKCVHFLNFDLMIFLYSFNDGCGHYELHESRGNGLDGDDYKSTDRVIGYFDSERAMFDFIFEWEKENKIPFKYSFSSDIED